MRLYPVSIPLIASPSRDELRSSCSSHDIGCRHCRLVGLDGLEPSTSRLSGARSSHLSYRPVSSFGLLARSPCSLLTAGGDDGIRTHDPLLAGQVLSQLSYTPILMGLLRSLSSRLKPDNWTTKSTSTLLRIHHLSEFICFVDYESSAASAAMLTVSIERRWSSRTFRYGYLVTT